jgi:hypothetical protein
LIDLEPALWLDLGQLGEIAEESWLSVVSGEDRVLRTGVRHKLDALKADIGHATASPLERLLIDRVGLTWLTLHYVEIMKAQLMKRHEVDYAAGEYLDRRVNTAQKRYLAAIRALATVRRLLTPQPTPVQVAHADQINVAGDGAKQANMAPSATASADPLPQLPPVTAEPANFVVVQPVREEAVLNGRAR